MLGLKLRDEFLGTHMPGTAISLRTNDNQVRRRNHQSKFYQLPIQLQIYKLH
ncbi:MAG: hypothetical protein BWY69_00091 [Planctomycetes bacterium ADurb.Bin401]|nr:MAG: hypothetical protein BWY69_00091 [Planctomycetes bacterium ADurb.Bin401]